MLEPIVFESNDEHVVVQNQKEFQLKVETPTVQNSVHVNLTKA